MNEQSKWSKVDDYFNNNLLDEDLVLNAVLDAQAGAGLPDIAVAPNQGSCCTCSPR